MTFKFKNLFFLLLAACLNLPASAQEDCTINLMAIALEQKGNTPPVANEYLFNRLANAVTSDGVSASGDYAQFFVAAKALVLYEQVIPGPPTKTALTVELNFFIGDFAGQKVFARTSLEVKGAGDSRERAFLNALRSLNKNNRKLESFLREGKEHILAFYDAEYPNIRHEAETATLMRDYEKALFLLSSVPSCCKGYDAVMEDLVAVYNEYISYDCERLLMAARSIWAANPNREGAMQVIPLLNSVEPDAKCHPEIMELYAEIKKAVKDDYLFETRDKYNDSVELRKQIVEAARAIGTAYGKGQQPTTTNLLWMK